MADVYTNWKFGLNESVANNTTEDVWPGPGTTFQVGTENEGIWMASSNVADVGTVKFSEPLFENSDGDWVIYTNQYIPLNGTIPVFVGSFVAVERARFDGVNAGTITIQRGTLFVDGVPDDNEMVRNHIAPGKKQSQIACITLPDGFGTFFIKSWHPAIRNTSGAAGAREADFSLVTNQEGETGWGEIDPCSLVKDGVNMDNIYFPVEFPRGGLTGKDRIGVRVSVTGGETSVAARFSVSNQR